ncbi:hypothetical protein [Spirillospora sp. CA-294931]|uniref:hypothetical protein n=1 Tax=Spirillospora sp. CA-294931 TaxID=3240042 RepID=UPI003D8AA5D7
MARTLTADDTDLAALDGLGEALGRLGLPTMIFASGAARRLEVFADQPGSVVCERDATGELWYWWSWADRIAPAAELDRAAEAVAGLLRR